jgi:predicted thioesterase
VSGLEIGLAAEVSIVVGESDTAVAIGSGDVEVLATPRVIALCEAATVKAVRGALPDGVTTVGSRVEMRHLAPSRVGVEVRASARLVQVDGRRLVFDAELSDAGRRVASGRIERVAVDRASFPG